MLSCNTVLILWCILTRIAYASEPQCSPFHYQEQMLEKMIKLEMLVQKMKVDMDVTQQSVLEVTQRLNDDVSMLKSEWDEAKSLIRNNTAKVKRNPDEQNIQNVQIMKENKDSTKIPTVAFQAYDLTNASPSNGETLIFKTTLLNEEQGYDNATGKFTAPLTGAYLFTAQFCIAGGGGSTHYAFVVDNVFMKRGYFRQYDSFSCFTADVITVLKTGARVWVTVPLITTTFYQNVNYWNSFSGVLVH